jgi:HEPN domain-containing protein
MASQRKSEARRWYQQAVYDLKAARWNTEGGFHSTACFLAQQAGEKALKSLLYYLGSRRAALFTHSLVEMIREVTKQAPTLSELIEEARALDLHYVPSRYPNGLPSGFPHQFYGKDTAAEAVQSSDRIVGAVAELYRYHGEDDILAEET